MREWAIRGSESLNGETFREEKLLTLATGVCIVARYQNYGPFAGWMRRLHRRARFSRHIEEENQKGKMRWIGI